jgi:hypothetical protein
VYSLSVLKATYLFCTVAICEHELEDSLGSVGGITNPDGLLAICREARVCVSLFSSISMGWDDQCMLNLLSFLSPFHCFFPSSHHRQAALEKYVSLDREVSVLLYHGAIHRRRLIFESFLDKARRLGTPFPICLNNTIQ